MEGGRPAVMPISSLTRREAVLNELRRAILAGELASGARLKEVQLARDLRVSRPTVREAIYQLIHEGLLTQEDYKGVSVAGIDAAAVSDIAVVRTALETIAAKEVAADKSGRSQQFLRQAWQEYQQAAQSGEPGRENEAHLKLHQAIWIASGNSMLQRIWPIISAAINLAISRDQAIRADSYRNPDLHQQLVAVILSNRASEIESEVRTHIATRADELVTIMTRRDSGQDKGSQ